MIASAAMSKVNGYVNDVLSGEILACDLVKKAVQRHVDDLARESTQDFPYHFDPTHAAIAVDFFPLVLRHSTGHFQGLPFELEPWQAFGVASIHGWKRDHDLSRRFRRVYWSQARKNGKSCWAAGEAIQLAMMDRNPVTGQPESVAEVILCATKKEQAEKVIYAEVVRMRNRSEHIKGSSHELNRQITFDHNDGYIRCVGSDKPYDGLNPHVTIKDEVHAWKEYHRPFYETLITGSGTRSQPIDITTTTAGDDHSYLWLEEYRHICAVLNGNVKDESVFALCYEIDADDDPFDEDCWIKANPNIGVAVKREYLREQAISHGSTRLKQKAFTRYHCNRLVSANEQAFDMDLWDKCEGTLSDWSEADAVGGGVDLGGRDDLAAYGLVARFLVREEETEDGEKIPIWRYELKAQTYIADDTERDLTDEPFHEWVYTDKIRKRKYPISDLRDDLLEDCRTNWVSDVAYDPAGGQQFQEEIDNEGIVVASMAQSCTQFNEPIGDILQAIRDGRVTHNGDPVLRWCATNAVVIRNRQDQYMFDKSKSCEKIDAIVAVTMAYRRAMVAPRRAVGDLFVTV